MIRESLYHKTSDVLYQAYFKDELKHGDCSACAVGNICKAAGASNQVRMLWKYVFVTETNLFLGQHQWINEDRYSGVPKKVIDATGYTWQELAKIEYAFETAPKGNNDEDWMFNGLVAVLDVLKEIHEVTDEPHQSNLSRFELHYKTK